VDRGCHVVSVTDPYSRILGFLDWEKVESPTLILIGIRKNCCSVEGIYYYTNLKKRGYEADYNNFLGISLLSTSYKMLSTILLPRFVLYIDEVTGDHQCGF
jgi:hypothetical protein